MSTRGVTLAKLSCFGGVDGERFDFLPDSRSSGSTNGKKNRIVQKPVKRNNETIPDSEACFFFLSEYTISGIIS